MTTIRQALDTLKKAGTNTTVTEHDYSDWLYGKSVITIEIPFGTPIDEEIEGTGKVLDIDYNDACEYALSTVYGLSSQAERASNAIDSYTKNLKEFKNRFFGDYRIPEVREIRYNGPATIVFWEDNTKTVVKMQPGEKHYDPDKAFAMAVCKKLFGNKFNRHLTKAQKACEEARKKRAKVVIDVMEDFHKLNEKWKLSLCEGTFDPSSVTTFRPKKEE